MNHRERLSGGREVSIQIIFFSYDLYRLIILYRSILKYGIKKSEKADLLLTFALENRHQPIAASVILGVMTAYIAVGIWWVSRKL